MAVFQTDKRTDIRTTNKTQGVQQGWKWRQNTDRCKCALEDDNYDGDREDKGQTEAADNGSIEMAELRTRAGSLHSLPSGIYLPSLPIRLSSEAEEQEVTDLASESEAASEEEVRVEDHWRFFRLCRWINLPFTCLRGSAEGAVEVVAVASEVEDRCAP